MNTHRKRHRTTQRRFWRLLATLASLALVVTACASEDPSAPSDGGEETTSDGSEDEDGGSQEPDDDEGDDAAGESGPISIGTLVPFTGDYSWVGANVQPVVDLLVEQINDSGGIDGRPIEVSQGDTEGVVDAGVTAVQQLIQTQDVIALIGPTSLSFTGVRQVIEDFQIPVISPTAGTVEFDDAGTDYFFRTVPSDSLGGRAIARAITDGSYSGGSAWERPAVMVGDAPALVSFEEPILEGLESYGAEVVANSRFSVGKQSYRSEVAEIMGTEPDVIVLVAQPEDSAKIMRAAVEAGYEGDWFMTQDQTNADYIELAGPEVADGAFGLVETAPEGAEDRLQAFADLIGQEPAIFQTNTYDAVNVTALAMLEAALAGEAISPSTINDHLPSVANPHDGDVTVGSFEEGREALEAGQTINYEGLGGPIDFNEYGNITAPFAIMQVVDGALESVAYVPADALN